MRQVWVLYEESGEYSDYGMGILGVFSGPAPAKDYVAAHCVAKLADIPDSTHLVNRTPWEQDESGEWHCETQGSIWNRLSWTIAPYAVDAPFKQRPPLHERG